VSLEQAATPAKPRPYIVWEDGAQLPPYFFDDDVPGLGHADLKFRGHAEVLAGLQGSTLPKATWDEIKAALEEEPASFLGDGRPFTVTPEEKGREPYEIVIEARPRGDSDRFYDINGATIRADQQHLHAGDVIAGKQVGTSRHLAFSTPFGPGPTPGTGFGQVAFDMTGNERVYTYGYGTTGVDQREMRVAGGSHVHVDDLDFTVRTFRSTDAGRRQETGTPVEFTVRGGLQVRLPDNFTKPEARVSRNEDSGLPRRFQFNGRVPDTYHVEQVGSTGPVFDAVLEMFPRSAIGSST
jgi:hypothetical protein